MTDVSLPQKKYYRQRAHCNPFSDFDFDYPVHPEKMDWSTLYKEFYESSKEHRPLPEFADIGCGFGGLLVALSSLYPSTLMLGLEIRLQVSEYVRDRIKAYRQQAEPKCQNVAVLRTNAMKFLPNYFSK